MVAVSGRQLLGAADNSVELCREFHRRRASPDNCWARAQGCCLRRVRRGDKCWRLRWTIFW